MRNHGKLGAKNEDENRNHKDGKRLYIPKTIHFWKQFFLAFCPQNSIIIGTSGSEYE